MRTAALVGFLLPLLAGPAHPAQSPPTVPGTRTELVRLDVVVTDARGRLVPGLQQGDFRLFEDGKPQTLAQFVVAVRPGSAAVPAAPPEPEPAPAAPRGPGRNVVVFVDDLHIAPGHLDFAREALRRFAAEFLGPDDRVALVTSSGPGGVQELTLDRAALAAAIDRLALRQATVGAARGSQMTAVQAELILRGDPSALQLATRNMRDEAGSVYSAQGPRAALDAAGGASPASIVDSTDRAAAQEVMRQARGILAEELRFSEVTLVQLDDVLRGLGSLPGRKLCLLVSDGFLVGTGTSDERTRHLRSVIDAATRSGAVVYALDTHGLTTTVADSSAGGVPAPAGLPERVDRLSAQEYRETLSGLANDTGGFLVRGTNDLATGLRRMLEDNDVYYLMAYEPTNTKRDGKFRRIEVRLPGHPDYVVRTRRGYLAPDGRKPAARLTAAARPPAAPSIDTPAARSALASLVPDERRRVRLTADFVSLPASGPQAIVRAHVDASDLGFREDHGRQLATVEIVGGVFDAAGGEVGAPFGRRASLDLAPAERDRTRRDGLQFQQRLALPPGRYEIRLLARDGEGGLLGATTRPLEVPDLAQGQLAMSSIFLSASAPSAEGVEKDDESPALRDAQVLRRFSARDTLYFQVYVYNPSFDEKGAADVVLQAQIRRGGQTIAASKPQAVTVPEKGAGPRPQTNGLGLEGLAPGRYDLRVVVADRRSNTTVARTVDFTVE
jgi:VWFA-related protein